MKRLVFTFLTLLTCGAAYALPVSNPCDAGLLTEGVFWEVECIDPCDPCTSWWSSLSFRLGFYGDYVFNRHMEVDSGDTEAIIEHTEIYTNAAFLAANLWDRLDVFATLGATNIYVETNVNAFGTPGPGGGALTGQRIALETDTDFSWSIGARGTVWEFGCLCFGAEVQYFHAHPNLRRITFADGFSIYEDNLLDVKYREWQIGLGVSTSIPFICGSSLNPYIAIKWARAKMNFDDAFFSLGPDVEDLIEGTIDDLKSEKGFGYAIGVTLVDSLKASVTVEARFADEKALYVNGQIRF